MIQHELLIEYIKEKGYIIPAKLNDKARAFRGEWIGSQADKRCRELRTQGILISEKEGKFEKFYLKNIEMDGAFLPKQIHPKAEAFLKQWVKPVVKDLFNANIPSKTHTI